MGKEDMLWDLGGRTFKSAWESQGKPQDVALKVKYEFSPE